jgi:hypothetical protein
MKKNNILNSLTTFLFYLSVLFFFIGFNFQDSRTGGWVRQYITAPIGSAPINGIDFKDSLIGYAITNLSTTGTDTNYILKTTNGGYNWNIVFNFIESRGFEIKSLNKDTLYVGSDFNIFRTYNGGQNWSIINLVGYSIAYGLFVLNTDTIWYASPTEPIFGGGLYRTTNGGINWERQFSSMSGVNGYAQSIYMYNRNIGFMGTDNGELLKTSNSGVNWALISGVPNFSDMYFNDSLTGFMASSGIYKTTNGGLNWQFQNLPNVNGGLYTDKLIQKFSYIYDTIYAVYSYVWYGGTIDRAIIYKSTNRGTNWGYQVPDTSFGFFRLNFPKFLSGLNGFIYRINRDGIVTYTGGDTTIYTGINNNITAISKDFILFQNYPNPFNPVTSIKYSVKNSEFRIQNSELKIVVYNITGREIKILVNEKKSQGNYEVKFDGTNLSSGIYFYTLFVDGVRIDSKKMILIK